MPRVLGLVLKVAWVILHSEIHLQNSLTKRNFKAESWISEQTFAQKAKNLALVLQWIKRSKQPARWRISSIQQQNWNAATILLIWSTKLPSVEPWQDKGAKNSYPERKTAECFQRKTIGSCSRRDARNSRRVSILFSTESERHRLTEKLEQSRGRGQSCD